MSLQKLITAQENDYERLLTQYERMIARAESLQSNGNDDDRAEGMRMMKEARELQNIIGDLRMEINDNIRQNNRP